MLSLLHRLPDLAILAVVLCTIVLAAVYMPVLSRRLFKYDVSKERDEAAFDAFKAVMAMIGVVLAFSLVQADANLRSIEATVEKEANALSATDRILLRIGRPDFAAARPILAAYGKAITEDEWPRLAKAERSAAADAAYTQLSKTVRALGPNDARETAMYNELLKNLDDLDEARESIVADSELHLPDFFWVTVGGLMLIGVGLALLTDATLSRRVGLGATAGAVALLLAFVIITDVPFEGQTSVSVHPIERALLVNARRA